MVEIAAASRAPHHSLARSSRRALAATAWPPRAMNPRPVRFGHSCPQPDTHSLLHRVKDLVRDLRWSQAAQIETALIDPGKPWQRQVPRRVPDAAVVPQPCRCQGRHLAVAVAAALQRGAAPFESGLSDTGRVQSDLAATITEGGSAAAPPRPDQEDRNKRIRSR
jgi:hypothetical protein